VAGGGGGREKGRKKSLNLAFCQRKGTRPRALAEMSGKEKKGEREIDCLPRKKGKNEDLAFVAGSLTKKGKKKKADPDDRGRNVRPPTTQSEERPMRRKKKEPECSASKRGRGPGKGGRADLSFRTSVYGKEKKKRGGPPIPPAESEGSRERKRTLQLQNLLVRPEKKKEGKEKRGVLCLSLRKKTRAGKKRGMWPKTEKERGNPPRRFLSRER